jgi:hypothetical protein
LVDHLSRAGHRVGLFARRIAEPEIPVSSAVTRFFGQSAGGNWARFGLDAGRHARRDVAAAIEASGASLIHSHGIWTPACHAVAAACAEAGVPHIISVRGMLEPWAIRSRSMKKSLAWTAYQRCDLVNAAAIHATSPSEMTAIRQMGLHQPVILVPNGIFDARPLSRFTKFWATPIAWMILRRRGGAVERTVAKEAQEEVATKLSRFVRARWFAPPFGGNVFSSQFL